MANILNIFKLALILPIIFVGALSRKTYDEPLCTDAPFVKIEKFAVPQIAYYGRDVTLECSYILEGLELYSLKWYKDFQEFYRYIPRDDKEKGEIVPAPNVQAELHPDSVTKVVVKKLSVNSSGKYRCEVSADSHNFPTARCVSSMSVFALPEKDLTIKGVKKEYKLNDVVEAKCTVEGTNPAATISWYINQEEVNDSRVSLEISVPEADLLYTTNSVLRFPVERSYFEGPLKRMVIRCFAKVNEYSWKKEVSAGLNEENSAAFTDIPHKIMLLSIMLAMILKNF